MKVGYAGKIKNSGNQQVDAVFARKAPKRGNVKTGKDLRAKGK